MFVEYECNNIGMPIQKLKFNLYDQCYLLIIQGPIPLKPDSHYTKITLSPTIIKIIFCKIIVVR